VHDGLIAPNPVDGVKVPRIRPAERRYLTVDQVEELTAAVEDHAPGSGLVVEVFAWVGLRWGELVALRPSHVDVVQRRPDGTWVTRSDQQYTQVSQETEEEDEDGADGDDDSSGSSASTGTPFPVVTALLPDSDGRSDDESPVPEVGMSEAETSETTSAFTPANLPLPDAGKDTSDDSVTVEEDEQTNVPIDMLPDQGGVGTSDLGFGGRRRAGVAAGYGRRGSGHGRRPAGARVDVRRRRRWRGRGPRWPGADVSANPPDSRYDEAAGLIEREQYRDAQQLLEPILAADPNDANAWHLYGTATYRAGDLDGAERAFRRRLAVVPDDPVAHYSLAVALRDRGSTDDAIKHLYQALALRPDFAPARERLAELEKPPAQPPPAPKEKKPPASDAPAASSASEIVGVATAVRSRVAPDPWLGRGQITVLTFRVSRHDASGNPLPPVPVELRGAEIDGDILEGDPVRVPGAWRPGRRVRPHTVTNLRTLQEIRGRQGVRGIQLLILALFLIAFATFVVVGVASR